MTALEIFFAFIGVILVLWALLSPARGPLGIASRIVAGILGVIVLFITAIVADEDRQHRRGGWQ